MSQIHTRVTESEFGFSNGVLHWISNQFTTNPNLVSSNRILR